MINDILYLLLAFGLGVVVYCFVRLVRIHDESSDESKNSEKSLHSSHEWDSFVEARRRYEASLQSWATEEIP